VKQGNLVEYILFLGRRFSHILSVALYLIFTLSATAQDSTTLQVSYANPSEYIIAHIGVRGTESLDKAILISLSGLRQGEKLEIPGEEISKAIKNLWKQKLFTNVSIDVDKVVGNEVFLTIVVEDRPRIKSYSLVGPKNSDRDELKKKMDIRTGIIFSDNVKQKAIEVIRNYYIDKGFLNVAVQVKEVPDTSRTQSLRNSNIVTFYVDKKQAVKIRSVNFEGVHAFSEPMLKHKMKETKERIKFDMDSILRFKSNFKKFGYHPKWYTVPGSLSPVSWYHYPGALCQSEHIQAIQVSAQEDEEDKKKVIEFYNTKGYRDARIVSDTVYKIDGQDLVVNIKNR
jgi:outer membrane protein insertion porin family